MDNYCVRCGKEGSIGSQTGLCSECWWKIAAWPSLRPNLSTKEREQLTQEKERFGVKDVRER